MGQASGHQAFSNGGCRKRDVVLSDKTESVRPATGQPEGVHQAGLGNLDSDPFRVPRRLSRPGVTDLRVVEQLAQSSSAHRLVLDNERKAGRLPGSLRGWRGLHQDAWRPCNVEEVVEQGPVSGGDSRWSAAPPPAASSNRVNPLTRLAEFTLSTRPPVGGLIVPETWRRAAN